jgi:hypothetical protein
MHPFFVCDQRQHLFASGCFLRTHFRRVRILGSFWPLSRTVRNVIWYWRRLDCFSRKSAIICVRYVKGSYPCLPRCSFQESPRWKWLKDLRVEIYSGSLLWVTFEWNDKMTCCNLKVKQIRCLAWSVLDFAVLFNKQQHCTRVAYSCVSCCSGTKIARK